MALRISRILTVTLIAVILALVVGCAKPKVQVQVSRDRLQQGEDVRVTWQSKDAKQVTLNGQQVDKVGSKVTASLFRSSLVMFLSVVRLWLIYSGWAAHLQPLSPVSGWVYRKLRNFRTIAFPQADRDCG